MALAAELLLAGLSTPKQLPRNVIICEMCKKVPKRYKCPGCAVQTCSLQCCNLHKQKLGCDGRRDETVYKPLSQLGDKDLLSDYLFLERICRKVSSTNRGFRKYRLEFRPEWVNRLVRACRRRCINLRTVAPNMSRGFRNKTCFISRRDTIMWQIEWIFPAINKKIIQTSVNENNMVSNALYCLVTENFTAAPLLRSYKSAFYEIEPDSEVDSKEREEKKLGPIRKCELSFLLRVKPNRNCFDRWHLIEKEQTLASNLRCQCIVEFPTIVVLLANESPKSYISQNGKVPSWIVKREAVTRKDNVCEVEKNGDGEGISEKVEREEGEISSSEDSSNEEPAHVSDNAEDEESEVIPSKVPKGIQATGSYGKMMNGLQPLVAYDTEDSDCSS